MSLQKTPKKTSTTCSRRTSTGGRRLEITRRRVQKVSRHLPTSWLVMTKQKKPPTPPRLRSTRAKNRGGSPGTRSGFPRRGTWCARESGDRCGGSWWCGFEGLNVEVGVYEGHFLPTRLPKNMTKGLNRDAGGTVVTSYQLVLPKEHD